MAIRITCPGCKSTLSLADELRGKKVRCKKCETTVKVPDADAANQQRADEEETAIQEKSRASLQHSREEDEEEEDRPKKKKKKKSKKGISPLMIVIPVVVLILLVVGGVSAFFLTRIPAPQPQLAKGDPKVENEVQKPQIFNKIQDGNPAKKGGLGIVSSVRGAVYRAERKVELANINKMFAAFILETPNKSQHTLENYLAYIERDYRPVHGAIKEGYYIMNMKAQGGNDIVAGERDLDQTGHLVVFFTGSVEYIPEADFKNAMGIK